MESEMMWGLLHPSLLAGEGGYYLAMLASTIHFLKNMNLDDEMEHQAKVLKKIEFKIQTQFLTWCGVPMAEGTLDGSRSTYPVILNN